MLWLLGAVEQSLFPIIIWKAWASTCLLGVAGLFRICLCNGICPLKRYVIGIIYSFPHQACADLPLWVSVALIGAVGTVYTTIGGFKSVIWTDAFQTVIVFIGVFANIIKGRVTFCLLVHSKLSSHSLIFVGRAWQDSC